MAARLPPSMRTVLSILLLRSASGGKGAEPAFGHALARPGCPPRDGASYKVPESIVVRTRHRRAFGADCNTFRSASRQP